MLHYIKSTTSFTFLQWNSTICSRRPEAPEDSYSFPVPSSTFSRPCILVLWAVSVLLTYSNGRLLFLFCCCCCLFTYCKASLNACILLGFPGKSVAPQTLKSSVSLPHQGYRISPALHLLFLMIPDGGQWKILYEYV